MDAIMKITALRVETENPFLGKVICRFASIKRKLENDLFRILNTDNIQLC